MQNTVVDKSCAVCFEGFNKSTRACTTCPYCSVEICRGCLQQYLLNDINIVPICVNADCKREWTRDFLDKELTSTFRLNTYKEHREKVLFDRERSKLPATQEDAAAYRAAKQSYDAALEEARRLDDQINELQRQLMRKRVEYRRYMATVDTYGRSRPAAEGTEPTPRAAPAAFVRPCPATDCRGFLSTAWKCSICDMYTCPDCHELKGPNREDPGHACDPNNIATARLLARDTKPCPKCGAGITKLEGCDQMWCTACNTGFNWRTGAVASGPVHNPHYFAWLAENPDARGAAAAPPQGDCGVVLDRQIMQKLTGRNNRNYLYGPTDRNLPASSRYLVEAWRLMRENESRLRGDAATDYDNEFHDLRVKYMLNMIREEAFKKALQVTEKNALHKQANRQVYEVFVNSVRDTIRQILTNDAITHKTLMEQVHQIHVYCTEQFKQIGKRFGRSEHSIVFRGDFTDTPAAAAGH